MPYSITFSPAAFAELADIKAYYRGPIVAAIDEQLANQPTVETRNRKMLIGLYPPFEHQEPVWELRVGTFRVYYDVNEDMHEVTVRAVRNKPLHSTTEQIL
jgi:mRNA-degrading endonuclease RelE of RelBE toxin-antitoxin system